MGVAVGAIIPATQWPFRTALFPITIGIPVFLVALTDLVLSMSRKKEIPLKESSTKRPEISSAAEVKVEDPAVTLRRTLSIFGWILGFLLLILLVGFEIAAPLYVFLYLKLEGKEGWKLTLIITAATFVFFYGLFVWILNTHFEEGWVFEGLRAIGIIE
jgi:hypothetical protein